MQHDVLYTIGEAGIIITHTTTASYFIEKEPLHPWFPLQMLMASLPFGICRDYSDQIKADRYGKFVGELLFVGIFRQNPANNLKNCSCEWTLKENHPPYSRTLAVPKIES
jgi:hypothetical protein